MLQAFALLALLVLLVFGLPYVRYRHDSRFDRAYQKAGARCDAFNQELLRLSEGAWSSPCHGWIGDKGYSWLVLKTEYMYQRTVRLVLSAAEQDKVVTSPDEAVLFEWDFFKDVDPAMVANMFWQTIQTIVPQLVDDEAAWQYVSKLKAKGLTHMGTTTFFNTELMFGNKTPAAA